MKLNAVDAILEGTGDALGIKEAIDIRKSDIKARKKDGWLVSSSPCKCCKGAGMVLSDTAQTW